MARSLLLALSVALASAARGGAQPAKPTLSGPPPCCAITAIDLRGATVTAEEASTGHVFRFAVTNPATLRGLKLAQKVWADFANARVTLDQAAGPCCNILGAAGPILNCCAITAIDPAARLVTARIAANGLSFRFEVTDPALLAGLKNGDRVWASGTRREAGLRPGEVCCRIVGAVPVGLP